MLVFAPEPPPEIPPKWYVQNVPLAAGFDLAERFENQLLQLQANSNKVIVKAEVLAQSFTCKAAIHLLLSGCNKKGEFCKSAGNTRTRAVAEVPAGA